MENLIPSVIPNVPLFITLMIILSYLTWSRFFSKDKKLSPKESKDIITIILILGLLITILYFSIFLDIWSIQLFLLTINLDSILYLADKSFLVIFFAFVYFLIPTKEKDFFEFINIFFISSFIGFVLPIVLVGNFQRYYTFFNKELGGILFLLTLALLLDVLISEILIKKIFEINGRKVHEGLMINKLKLIVMIVFFFVVGFLLIVLNLYSFAPKVLVNSTSYEIYDTYPKGTVWAEKETFVYYSKHISQSANKVVLKIDSEDLDIEDGLQKNIELYLNYNNSLSRVAEYSLFGKEINSHNITKVSLIGNELYIEFNNLLFKDDFDNFVIKGVKEENISKEYQITYERDRYYFEDSMKFISINFEINNSLFLPVDQRDYVLFFNWINTNKENCSQMSFDPVLIKDGINICRKSTCSGIDCDTRCGNWDIRIVPDENRLLFMSQTGGETGSLKIKAAIYCDQ